MMGHPFRHPDGQRHRDAAGALNVESTYFVVSWSLLLSFMFLAAGCAQDPYARRAEIIKAHTRHFYEHLQAGRVPDAVVENERIEMVATQWGKEIRQRPRLPAVNNNEVDRDWMLWKAANEAAAENWLALARYLVLTKQYASARETYRRILSTYTDSANHHYADQARKGLQDLDLIINSTHPP